MLNLGIDGIMAFVTISSWLRAQFGSGFRRFGVCSPDESRLRHHARPSIVRVRVSQHMAEIGIILLETVLSATCSVCTCKS